MNAEELGFFNRQLAGMLKAGIPLEGSLKKLCESLPGSQMRTRLLALEKDLAAGTPLAEAVKKNQLPDLYARILTVGAASGDLPKVLILFADYCGQRHSLSRRLRGLMVYPLIVLTVALVVAILMTLIFHAMGSHQADIFLYSYNRSSWFDMLGVALWFTPVLIGLIWLFFALITFLPFVRRQFQWYIPGLRETCLAQLASLVELQLRSGIPLPVALETVEMLEGESAVSRELSAWRNHLAGGGGSIPGQPVKNRSVPPLFRWLVRQSGEDAVDGFGQAARFYTERSASQNELLLYSALPVSVLILGGVIMIQLLPVFSFILRGLDLIGDFGP